MSSYINIKDMIKRDIQLPVAQKMYQIQGIASENCIIIIRVADRPYVPNVIIFDRVIDEVQCVMISYIISESEISEEKKWYSMVGYNFNMDEEYIGSLTFVFVPKDMPNMKDIIKTNLYGHFEIHFEYKMNGKIEKEMISEIANYPGMEESLYILTEVLLERNVIERIKEKNQ